MISVIEGINFEDYLMIIPSVAVGNVGQLAVDLLISNLNLKRIGQIWSNAFIPVVGLDPYKENSDEICTAIDLYVGTEKKVVVVQIRSPLTRRPVDFFNDLQKFITEQKISKVVILTSSYAYEKRHDQFGAVDFRYVASSDIFSKHKEVFENLKWVRHEPSPSLNGEEKLQVPGGGFAISLFEFLSGINVPCIVLFKFCSEGDNIPDAIDLMNYLNEYIKLLDIDNNTEQSLKHPPSWKYLFGNPPAPEIY